MLQKRLDYGSSGYHVPFVPRARRSARRRGLVQKKVEDNQLCAFDLLATIAGKILLEGESSHETLLGTDFSNVQNENVERGNTEAASPPLTLELGIRGLGQDIIGKESPEPLPDASLVLEKNGSLEKIDLNEPSGLSPDLYCRSGEIEGHSQGYIDPCVPFVVKDGQCCVNGGEGLFGDCSDSHKLEDPEILDRKSPVVSSDGSVKLTLGNDYYPCSSLSPCRDNNNNDVNLVSRDDDENSSECIQPSTIKTARSTACIGDRRIRKLLDSKYWRIASKARDGDLTDSEVRSLFRSRKTGYKRQGSKRIYPFKRRKYYRHSSLSSTRAEISYKGVFNYSDKAIFSMGVNGSSACSAGQSATFSSRESHVKFKIKSFRVPELFIEMPETATIGSLKRTVMEAFSALLGGGLRVGVHLQGKKIRDDNRTLLQSGLCHDNKAESLGFSLEPNPSQIGPPVCCKKSSPVLTPVVPQAVSWCPITSSIHQGTSHHITDHPATNLGNIIESDHDSAPFPTNLPTGKDMVDSRSLVALPDGTPQPLAVSYSHQKFKRSDLGQRRIRRPFSVSEVEALVHAVEKLGTGRWRDVKLLAFDNVKHRTYVDLKDKWKTLVHTAQIAPQQRRGEPVPQELLDRVLAAHSYWTHQQAKLQIQPPPTEAHLLV